MKKNYTESTETNNVLDTFSWESVQTEMKIKFGSDIYESWIKKIKFINEYNDYILLAVSTRFIRDWITSRYLDQILKIAKSFKKKLNRIEFIVEDTHNQSVRTEDNNSNNSNITFIEDSFLQYNRMDPNKKFENFIIGNSNKIAFEASKKVSEDLAHYNPLYIYSGVGMGKNSLAKFNWTKFKI